MGIESEGRKAVLCEHNEQEFLILESDGSIDASQYLETEIGRGIFFTLPQIAKIEASHAQALVAARGEGAVAMKSAAIEEVAESKKLFELICTELCFHSEGEQCKFAPCAECKNEERFAYYEPQGLAIMDCIRALKR